MVSCVGTSSHAPTGGESMHLLDLPLLENAKLRRHAFVPPWTRRPKLQKPIYLTVRNINCHANLHGVAKYDAINAVDRWMKSASSVRLFSPRGASQATVQSMRSGWPCVQNFSWPLMGNWQKNAQAHFTIHTFTHAHFHIELPAGQIFACCNQYGYWFSISGFVRTVGSPMIPSLAVQI